MIWEFLPKASDNVFVARIWCGRYLRKNKEGIQNELIKRTRHYLVTARGPSTEERDDVCQFRVLYRNVNKLLCKQPVLHGEYSGSSRATLRNAVAGPVANPLWQGRGYLSYGNWLLSWKLDYLWNLIWPLTFYQRVRTGKNAVAQKTRAGIPIKRIWRHEEILIRG